MYLHDQKHSFTSRPAIIKLCYNDLQTSLVTLVSRYLSGHARRSNFPYRSHLLIPARDHQAAVNHTTWRQWRRQTADGWPN